MWIPDNKEQYYEFKNHKQEIEEELGEQLLWESLEGKKGARISSKINGLSFENKDNYHDIMKEAINKLCMFKKAFKKYLIA